MVRKLFHLFHISNPSLQFFWNAKKFILIFSNSEYSNHGFKQLLIKWNQHINNNAKVNQGKTKEKGRYHGAGSRVNAMDLGLCKKRGLCFDLLCVWLTCSACLVCCGLMCSTKIWRWCRFVEDIRCYGFLIGNTKTKRGNYTFYKLMVKNNKDNAQHHL